ncbi:protease [Pyxidicoccus fallax]|uniref:Protease n=1 Tax=Pyxidicoccus fallax TaxID=394095 RepID=A0A848LI70_9BACT|nr:M57 family metalloprotease [Pyxidicoccus fallax]NMO17406.1 protease [Pyxidicoccus fallax]NPC77895.1 protease [Pyxidicoccus fallax]
MFARSVVLAAGCIALMFGCAGQPDETQEIVDNLSKAGFPADDIQVIDGAVYVGGDVQVSLEASRERLQRPEGSQEQYRHPNLVSTAVTKICINPTATFNSYAQLSQGLNEAIINYNVLALRIHFVRGPATGCTANIAMLTTTGTGGTSGFPSGGLPYNQIRIGTGLNSYNLDYIEHLITHEIGHTLGLAHSDAYNPAISCGTGGGGTPGTGAIHIPGTPTTATPGGSIMNTCIPPNTNGEFTSTDIAALNFLY